MRMYPYPESSFWHIIACSYHNMIPSTSTIFLCVFFICLCCNHCAAESNITVGGSIADKNQETPISPLNMFQMGFFTPDRNPHNNNRYLGIWYFTDPSSVVWVANHDKPLPDTSAVLTIDSKDHGLKLLDKYGNVYFSKYSGPDFNTLKLSDSGNAVLVEDKSGKVLWQSFDDPTDTFLAGMKINNEFKLISWKNQKDPGVGEFTFLHDDQSYNIFQSSTLYWKSGVESATSLNPNIMFNSATDMLEAKSKVSLAEINPRIVMNYTGEIQYLSWDKSNRKWILEWSEPKDNCSVYNACGPFGICNAINKDFGKCSCLRGFSPSDPEKWNLKNYTLGCKRVSEICMDNTNDFKAFLELNIRRIENPASPMSLPDNEQDCREECIKDCRCQAYSYYAKKNTSNSQVQQSQGAGTFKEAHVCRIWTSDLIDLQVGEPRTGGLILAIRLANSTGSTAPKQLAPNRSGRSPRKPKSSSLKFIGIAIIISFSLLLVTSIIAFRTMVAKRRENKERSSELQLYDNRGLLKDLLDLGQTKENDTEGIGVPLFELETILAATNGLSDSNKLGQGGFGPVYKGTLPRGLEFAVKRLSSHSGQGLEEFKNEVVLIAKLQHRNLVKLLGYCIEGNEKMLIYEFMTNKSLDTFIFDRTKCTLLDWTKRYDIILGIARGLLYLHQDSRLRIIHRDLKTSNILLDEDMNPKISDFGLAKIVKGKDTEASTNRVIGTYGYMSPEYALDGLFSVKSDVFSFGVVVLEIISGKRNTGFYQSEKALSLLGMEFVERRNTTLFGGPNATEIIQFK